VLQARSGGAEDLQVLGLRRYRVRCVGGDDPGSSPCAFPGGWGSTPHRRPTGTTWARGGSNHPGSTLRGSRSAAEVAGYEVAAAENVGPVLVGRPVVHVHSAVLAAMADQIGLAIAVQVQARDTPPPRDGRLQDHRGHGLAPSRHVLRQPDVTESSVITRSECQVGAVAGSATRHRGPGTDALTARPVPQAISGWSCAWTRGTSPSTANALLKWLVRT
jgi:hypothetical protein